MLLTFGNFCEVESCKFAGRVLSIFRMDPFHFSLTVYSFVLNAIQTDTISFCEAVQNERSALQNDDSSTNLWRWSDIHFSFVFLGSYAFFYTIISAFCCIWLSFALLVFSDCTLLHVESLREVIEFVIVQIGVHNIFIHSRFQVPYSRESTFAAIQSYLMQFLISNAFMRVAQQSWSWHQITKICFQPISLLDMQAPTGFYRYLL